MAGTANSGQRKDKLIREGLMLAAKRVHDGDPEGRMKLAIACEKVVEAAVNGDLASFNAMADRLDGKAIQATESTLDVNVTHHDARQRLSRKLHAVVDARPTAEVIELTH